MGQDFFMGEYRMVRLPLGGAGAGGVRGGRDENKGSESSIHHGYVTHETSVSVVILTIDSPLHPLCGSFPRWGTRFYSDQENLMSKVQFVLSVCFADCSPIEESLFAWRLRHLSRDWFGN